MTPRERPALFSVTASAAAQIKKLLAQRETPAVGIRIAIKTRGCSGLAYTLEYADDIHPHEEMVKAHGVTLIIEPKATMFVVGTEMDFQVDKMAEGFVFNNPNEKGRCGCGESFHV
ncbi:iron-sulfur cluster assembly accessory protein [Alphaproteobacteria bacterium]|nr:iron-sulfur cluster assembly accessory protein [Alphaproteobacteria bacterium]